ncbi:MAG: YdcF family protein [Oscillospiraceae bacterium]|jgi:uncharacterized SAM-binding protein YcdF (DUF218 family)|nr:YdcF family protein [Oscillospiraceae bacterium]
MPELLLSLARWSLAPALLFLALFLLLYRRNRTHLATAFCFLCFLITGMLSLVVHAVQFWGAWWLNALVMLVFGALLLVAAFGIYFLLAFLLLNTWSVLRREGFRLQHALTLILAGGILAFLLALRFLPGGPVQRVVLAAGCAAGLYYFLHVSLYLVNTLLCNCARPKANQDYIIILGCGLKKDGAASPLLAARIDRALRFYRKQEKKGIPPPKLICSGGQGSDEMRPEAEAMAEYALLQGIPQDHIITEAKSVNTMQNMRFSKEIMDAGGKPYRCIYCTSNYHVLRAGVYARRAGLPVPGIGSKTAFYFLANAFLREYVAYLRLYLKWNLALTGLAAAAGLAAMAALPSLLNLFG